jgi:hypothetical protein
VERVGSKTDAIYSFTNQLSGYQMTEENQSIPDYTAGINRRKAAATSLMRVAAKV